MCPILDVDGQDEKCSWSSQKAQEADALCMNNWSVGQQQSAKTKLHPRLIIQNDDEDYAQCKFKKKDADGQKVIERINKNKTFPDRKQAVAMPTETPADSRSLLPPRKSYPPESEEMSSGRSI
ncbi:MAG: hypothetical protein MSD82_03030 [Prevotella sp.]|nr:hypothetical protein [Prevotella sp.]